ncbi:MAG: hypothetical protein U0R24_01645 [Solirubrobacterales bacterium]
MATTTVRVNAHTRDALTRLSRERGISTAELVDELVARREQDELLERMNDAYALQRQDPAAWEAEQHERGAWETTLLDGLTDL